MRSPLGQRLTHRLSAMLLLAALAAGAAAQAVTPPQPESVTIDASAPATPFPHFWEQTFGSGRAILALRRAYTDDLEAVHAVTGFRNVRFHAILHDEVGVYDEDAHGNAVYNFTLVDQIYDGLLARGVRPFVEISFMPRKLAFNPDALHAFWYKQNVSPPKDQEKWNALMRAFARHLIDRYGIDEVSQWYFEVWNEPNLDFFISVPQQESYFVLYDNTARALKSVSPRLQVGGPATSAAHWIPAFLAWTSQHGSPVDFVSSHGYADDSVEEMLETTGDVPRDQRVCRAIEKVDAQIAASPHPGLPLFWTEWNVQGERNSRDTVFVGPALADTIRQCDGKVKQMSFWTFSDVFEEGGPFPQPFIGGFGLRATGGINKPSFYGFGLLHQLGDQRLASPSQNVLITRRGDGALVIAAWNKVDPGDQPALPPGPHDSTAPQSGTAGPTRTMELHFTHLPAGAHVTTQVVDGIHGNVLPKYAAMGSPLSPTPAQVKQLNQETALPAPTTLPLDHGTLKLTVGPNALCLVTLQP